jgi:hypothetical protein
LDVVLVVLRSKTQNFIQGMEAMMAVNAVKVGTTDAEFPLHGGDIAFIRPLAGKSLPAMGTRGLYLIEHVREKLLDCCLHAA